MKELIQNQFSLIQSSEPAEAVKLADEFLKLHPHEAEAWRLVATAHRRNNDLPKAEQAHAIALAYGGPPVNYLTLFDIHLAQGQYDKAEQALSFFSLKSSSRLDNTPIIAVKRAQLAQKTGVDAALFIQAANSTKPLLSEYFQGVLEKLERKQTKPPSP